MAKLEGPLLYSWNKKFDYLGIMDGNKYDIKHNKHQIKIYKKCKQNTYKKYEHNRVYQDCFFYKMGNIVKTVISDIKPSP